ncbi:MAG TPA: copper homeostasis protein CutC [Acidobacteriaceae bacterium]|nr:copper homeostasis protein CutC [Acidobacteriaceae bacterium]
MQVEICVDSVESAIAAERGGAQRVELCSDLLEGGITPSAGLIATVRRRIGIGLFVMIRPRGGDFCYTDFEFEAMQEDIRRARQMGADGLVFGVLDQHARVDVGRTRKLVELAGPLPVTFHRAIDMTPDPCAALNDVVAAGVQRVLTSGGAARVSEGLPVVEGMVKAADGRVGVMAGGGITQETIARIAAATGACEFHASLRSTRPSPVDFHRRNVQMGEVRDREYLRFAVEEESVRALVAALQRLAEERAAAGPR